MLIACSCRDDSNKTTLKISPMGRQSNIWILYQTFGWFMVFNTTFNNIFSYINHGGQIYLLQICYEKVGKLYHNAKLCGNIVCNHSTGYSINDCIGCQTSPLSLDIAGAQHSQMDKCMQIMQGQIILQASIDCSLGPLNLGSSKFV